MNSTHNDDLTLILGGSGKTGRRVAERLRTLGRPVRAVSRSTSPRFDWDDRSTWAAALDGSTQAYVTYQPDLAAPGACETVTAFFAQAVRSGVKRLVLLSGRGEPEAQEAEAALKASGADWTILRCSWFAQNFSEGFLQGYIAAGDVALPVGHVVEPFVDLEDVAEVAVAALTQPGHSAQLYELTGPHAISFPQAIAAIGDAAGRAVRFTTISPEELRAGLQQAPLSAREVDLILYLFTELFDGRNEKPADGVHRALGRPARGFNEFVRRTAVADVWKG
jgi:uncharacterized protein YbjT (DUF2867 family)